MKIEKRPSGSYRVRKMYKGQMYTVTFEHKPTQKEAMLAMADELQKVQKKHESLNFKAAAEEYIEAKRNVLSPTTIFQSTRPSRASTAIFTNFSLIFFSFISIMLHFFSFNSPPLPKILIFYALFPVFSSANIPTFPCPLHIRTKKSTVLSHQIQALPLYAPPYFYIGFPDYKISGCLYLYQ